MLDLRDDVILADHPRHPPGDTVGGVFKSAVYGGLIAGAGRCGADRRPGAARRPWGGQPPPPS